MLTTACATGVGVDIHISHMVLNPPNHNRMLKWFNFSCKWCWEVQYTDFLFLWWADCEHICQRPAAVFDAAVCWLSDHLIDDAVPPFTGTLPDESQPGCSSKQEKKKKKVFTRTFSYFVFARQWLDSFVCLPWLSFSKSRSQVHGTHAEQSPPFSQHPEMCSRTMLQNFKCFAPLRKHFTIIRQVHRQFFADLAFWIYQTYTKLVCSIFTDPVNPSTLNVEGIKGFQEACLTSMRSQSVKLKHKVGHFKDGKEVSKVP